MFGTKRSGFVDHKDRPTIEPIATVFELDKQPRNRARTNRCFFPNVRAASQPET